ncbi:MAG: hypothetical protein GFGODING_01389 [Flavobacteriales bacterium]|jgi:hypothetical protein|nr:hypothetical protein [Flavobacteriales bacterium]
MRGRPFENGDPRAGRPAGSANRSTAAARDAFNLLLEGNVDKLQQWIDHVAAEDPHKAFNMVMDLAAFVVPKMKAVELSAPPDQTIIVEFTG